MKSFYYLIILSFLLISCEKNITLYQSQNFVKYFGSGYESKGNDIILTSEGYVFTGFDKMSDNNYQSYICEVDFNGNLKWATHWGESGIDEGKIIKEIAGGFLVAGTTEDGTTIHSFLLKLNSEGTVEWSRVYGGVQSNFIVNDILLTQDNIYLVGQYDSLKTSKYQSYLAKLNRNDGSFINFGYFPKTNFSSQFTKGFTQSNEILLIGTFSNATSNQIELTPIDQSTLFNTNNYTLSDLNLKSSDAIFRNEELYILVNEQTATNKSLLLIKLNSSSSFQEVWRTSAFSGLNGKTFVLKEDETILVCGDKVVGTDSKIYFIKVGSDGVAGTSDEFRTFSGYASKIIETYDKGVIMVGTTAPATNGTMIQLIKTDMDYFMLMK